MLVYGLGIMKVVRNGKRETTLKMDAVLEMEHGLFGRKMDRNLKKPSIRRQFRKQTKILDTSIIFLKFDLPENSVIYLSNT
ncbi:MAG: hypothetical protein CM15mP106_3940 [Candidatus Neomarinimicrobiota bacterium]|nr:MAG: hypothetical protein CM15mP106_3940 [Candidatus Neomarinimicrobiota bacterium]